MRIAALPAALLAALLALSAASADTLYLKSGAVVSGEVLKEKAEALVVDLGHEVVSVPRDQVLRREQETYQAKTPDRAESDFYLTAERLPQASVKELVERFGGGVVLISTPNGLGSGFVVNAQGFVVTNFHVIQGEQDIDITLFLRRGRVIERRKVEKARIVATNPFMDLALLQFPPPPDAPLPTLYLGRTEEVSEGQPVFAIGNPLGLERSVSEGIVSTNKRNFGGLLYIQTTAAINPGNSGGPLFNLKGEVIGVTNMKAGFLTEGLSFAIPVGYLKDFLRNHDAFAFDKDNPSSGFHYLRPPRKPGAAHPAAPAAERSVGKE